ncbi:hypothetical protein BC835DRAFT_1054863 [Cytidiella melzeri]|nr:hypothetical protein BC835DRAFT_1054863 [Cytidiella melzeri]
MLLQSYSFIILSHLSALYDNPKIPDAGRLGCCCRHIVPRPDVCICHATVRGGRNDLAFRCSPASKTPVLGWTWRVPAYVLYTLTKTEQYNVAQAEFIHGVISSIDDRVRSSHKYQVSGSKNGLQAFCVRVCRLDGCRYTHQFTNFIDQPRVLACAGTVVANLGNRGRLCWP